METCGPLALKAQVKATTSAAAPPVCNTAANKGHWNTTLLTPVTNCKADKAKSQRATVRMPGMWRKRQPKKTSTTKTTAAALRCTK
jgi:hypothetical protein